VKGEESCADLHHWRRLQRSIACPTGPLWTGAEQRGEVALIGRHKPIHKVSDLQRRRRGGRDRERGREQR
jgi:hypothetical protein